MELNVGTKPWDLIYSSILGTQPYDPSLEPTLQTQDPTNGLNLGPSIGTKPLDPTFEPNLETKYWDPVVGLNLGT